MTDISKAEAIIRLKNVAVRKIDDNQTDFKVSDEKESLLYTAAYNDGVLDMLKSGIREILK